MDTINASASPEVQINENFDTLTPGALFGRKSSTTSGLTWGYYGGIFPGSYAVISDATLTLTDAATNYIECDSAGTVYQNTSAFTAGRYRLYAVVCAGGVVTSYTDYRRMVGVNVPNLSADNTWTGQNTFASGTITTSKPVGVTQTWNDAGVTFTGIDLNITDTASAAGSFLANLRVGGTSKFSVTKAGVVTVTGAVVGATSQNVFNTVSTTVNAFGAATTISLGAATGTLTVNNATLAAKVGTFSGILSTADATDATSATAASLKTAGGIASVKSAWIGANAIVVGNLSVGTTDSVARIDAVGTTSSFEVLRLSDRTTNATEKRGGVTNRHYTNAEENLALILGQSTSTTNKIFIGGGTSVLNAATEIAFYTAATNTTVTGTTRLSIDSAGVVTIANLAGTGTRNVVVDANGVMSAP